MSNSTTIRAPRTTPPPLADPSRFVRVPDVPIVDEHDDYTHERMSVLVANARRRIARGDLPMVWVGHTIRGEAPEQSQPPRVGYLTNLELSQFDGRSAIVADLFIDKHYYDSGVLARFPRRSIEAWHDADWEYPESWYIDGVSLLVRAPNRDLGLVTMARPGGGMGGMVCDRFYAPESNMSLAMNPGGMPGMPGGMPAPAMPAPAPAMPAQPPANPMKALMKAMFCGAVDALADDQLAGMMGGMGVPGQPPAAAPPPMGDPAAPPPEAGMPEEMPPGDPAGDEEGFPSDEELDAAAPPGEGEPEGDDDADDGPPAAKDKKCKHCGSAMPDRMGMGMGGMSTAAGDNTAVPDSLRRDQMSKNPTVGAGAAVTLDQFRKVKGEVDRLHKENETLTNRLIVLEGERRQAGRRAVLEQLQRPEGGGYEFDLDGMLERGKPLDDDGFGGLVTMIKDNFRRGPLGANRIRLAGGTAARPMTPEDRESYRAFCVRKGITDPEAGREAWAASRAKAV